MPDTPAQICRDMADRIEKTNEAEFAGAAVVVPPGGGEPIALLLVDPKQDLVQFWATVKSRVEIVTTEVAEAARSRQQGWGR
jgi:hypothetical protein